MNNVTLVGRLAKDVTLRFTKSGKPVATFDLAVKRRFVREGEPQADFFPIVVWGAQGESCNDHIAKGHSYDAKDGSKRYITEIVAEDVDFLAAAGEKGASSDVADEEVPF